MFSNDANFFFEDPSKYRQPPGNYGVLYLLRRDIAVCMGIAPASQPNCQEALWPGAMAILAGVDLLAKFYAGSDESGKVGERFKTFIEKYFQPLSPNDKETVYQLRNSLLHSFGLYSKTLKNQEYRFILDQKCQQFISSPRPDFYLINIRVLYQRFEAAVLKYQTDLTSDIELQKNFSLMFPNYGALQLCQ